MVNSSFNPSVVLTQWKLGQSRLNISDENVSNILLRQNVHRANTRTNHGCRVEAASTDHHRPLSEKVNIWGHPFQQTCCVSLVFYSHGELERPPSNTWFLLPHVPTLKGTQICSAVFGELTVVAKQTRRDRQVRQFSRLAYIPTCRSLSPAHL